MLQYLSELVGIRAEDGTGGIAGLNLRATKFAENHPFRAVAIVVALAAWAVYLIYLNFA